MMKLIVIGIAFFLLIYEEINRANPCYINANRPELCNSDNKDN